MNTRIDETKIATFKLNADWIVLSACNTAAGDGAPDAGGLPVRPDQGVLLCRRPLIAGVTLVATVAGDSETDDWVIR